MQMLFKVRVCVFVAVWCAQGPLDASQAVFGSEWAIGPVGPCVPGWDCDIGLEQQTTVGRLQFDPVSVSPGLIQTGFLTW